MNDHVKIMVTIEFLHLKSDICSIACQESGKSIQRLRPPGGHAHNSKPGLGLWIHQQNAHHHHHL